MFLTPQAASPQSPERETDTLVFHEQDYTVSDSSLANLTVLLRLVFLFLFPTIPPFCSNCLLRGACRHLLRAGNVPRFLLSHLGLYFWTTMSTRTDRLGLRLVVRPRGGSRLAPRGAWALLFKAESANLGQFASTHCPHLRCYYYICERCFGISFTAHAYCIRART